MPHAHAHAPHSRVLSSLLFLQRKRERERQFSSIAHPHVAGTRSGHAHSRNRTPYTVDPLAIFCYADCREGEHRNGCRGWTHEIVFPRDPDERIPSRFAGFLSKLRGDLPLLEDLQRYSRLWKWWRGPWTWRMWEKVITVAEIVCLTENSCQQMFDGNLKFVF